MKSKGFTLIELLAVIVILAIIALIATPIILNIIEDAKEESAERSAENYLEAVELAVAKENMEREFNPESCTIVDNGNLKCDEETTEIKVEIDGEVPEELTGSKITFTKGKVTGGNFKISGTNFVIEDGKLVIRKLEGDQTDDSSGLKKISSACTPSETQPYQTKVNEPGYKYNCIVDPNKEAYTFYVLSKEGTKINLIMDSNVRLNGEPVKEEYPTDDERGGIAWVTTLDYIDAGGYVSEEQLNDGGQCQYGNICEMNSSTGPISAMNYLFESTKTWTKASYLNETYNDEGLQFENFKINGYARLPYYSEVEATLCSDESGSCPKWMYNYLQYESAYENDNFVEYLAGYWLFDSCGVGEMIGGCAYQIYAQGVINSNYQTNTAYGVRPVISFEI